MTPRWPRVVVTGLGAVAPGGTSALRLFEALLVGASCVRRLDEMLDERFDVRIGAPIEGFDGVSVVGAKEDRRQARFTKLAIAAAREAIADAELRNARYDADRIGTSIGVGLGGIEFFTEACATLAGRGPDKISPFALPGIIPNMAAGLVAMEVGALGPSSCPATACASATHALGESLERLRRGEVDAVVAGGAEAVLTPLGIAGFARMGALSRRNDSPESASRPFDRARDGFVLGEGAGILVLEREADARRRGARIYAELAGAGFSTDAHHRTSPREDGRGAALAMRQALRDARLVPDEVGYVNAHGTSTAANDVMETRAIHTAFGEHARSLWVSSTKGVTGHLLGASGAVEAIATVLALHRGLIPPTANLEHAGDGCDLDYVPRMPRERRFGAALSNTFAFGGNNGCLAFRRYG